MSGDPQIQVVATIGRFQKNAMQSVEARLTRVRGVPCVDLRVFGVNAAGQVVPTRSGICISRQKVGELQKLVDALVAASADGGAGDEDTPVPNQEDEA